MDPLAAHTGASTNISWTGWIAGRVPPQPAKLKPFRLISPDMSLNPHPMFPLTGAHGTRKVSRNHNVGVTPQHRLVLPLEGRHCLGEAWGRGTATGCPGPLALCPQTKGRKHWCGTSWMTSGKEKLCLIPGTARRCSPWNNALLNGYAKNTPIVVVLSECARFFRCYSLTGCCWIEQRIQLQNCPVPFLLSIHHLAEF
jgi:hypothetical protein